MLIQTEDNRYIDGANIVTAVLRNALVPIPVTFEARIRIDETSAPFLLEGKELKVGNFQTPVTIKWVKDEVSSVYQAGMVQIRHIIALHSGTHEISHVTAKGLFIERTNLSTIYQACGSKSDIGKDFLVDKFYLNKGQYPSYQIQQICQEHGGVVRWIPQSNTLEFTRISDLFRQQPTMGLNEQILTDQTVKSGLLERHEVPSYVSTDSNGTISKGNFDKTRNVIFTPDKSPSELNLMTDVLINAKKLPSHYAPEVNSGEIIKSGETLFVIITAVHSFQQNAGAAGSGEESCSVFWLGVKQ